MVKMSMTLMLLKEEYPPTLILMMNMLSLLSLLLDYMIITIL